MRGTHPLTPSFKKRRGTHVLLLLITLIICGLGYVYVAKSDEVNTEIVIETIQESQYQITDYIVEDGDVFASVMENLGFGYMETMDILDMASSTYDFTSIRVG